MNRNLSGSNQGRQAGVLFSVAQLSKQKGFTLIEVMIVMIIMSIMAAIAIPSFSTWREKQAVRNATQALLAQMKQARVLAVSENRSVSVTFASTSYIFDANIAGTCGLCKNAINNLSQYSSQLSISSNKTPITFSSRGTAGNGTITLSAGAYSKKITVNLIGRAYLK